MKETRVVITDMDLIDPNQHDLFWAIMDQIGLFNTYDDAELDLRSDDEFLALRLAGRQLMSAEDFEVLDRVKQLNRERGYDLLAD